ncbi:MAG TPA: AAA family ATPase [Jatrophihabitantaceae bacterium]|nr:AAA family ATPase [Jatrophihabitantaceae bacterium]
MPSLRIDLTGQVPGIVRAGQPTAVAALQRPQTRLALAVLVLERDSPPTKHRLSEILWPDGSPPTWETALRGTVSRVRAALLEAGLTKDAVTSSSTGVRVCLPPDTVVDVELAMAELAAAEQALAAGAHERAYAAACAAGSIASAPLLPDCGGEWVEQWRGRLASWHQRTLAVAAQSAVALGRYPAAVAAAEDALRADPYAEWAFRILMRAREAAGERAAALDVYERCRRRLRDDLGASPSPETEAAYLALLGADPSVADSRFPLVGRQTELATLAAQWARASTAGPRSVVLVGEPGAGKSRLAGEFAESLQAAGHLVLHGREDGHLSVPFRPFADALADYLAARGPAVLDELGVAAGDLARLRAAAPSDSFAQPPGGAGPGRLFAAVRSWLRAATRSEPVALVVEDLQWASVASVSLLRQVLADEGGLRLLVIATCRVGEVAHPDLAAELAALLTAPGVLRLDLPPLRGEHVDELLDAAVGRHLPELATVLADRAAGNPLYVAEMIRHLLAQRQRTGVLDAGSLDLPAALGELVQLRLRALGPSLRPVLELAALAGDQVDLEVLAHATGDPDATRAALARGVNLGLVSLDNTTVRFHHDVLRECVDVAVDDARRPRLHRALAVAFDARGLDDEVPRRAHHWGCAVALGDFEADRAVLAHQEAARQASARLAFRRAVEHLDAARAILDAHDPAETKLTERCNLMINLGAAMHDAGDAGYVTVLQEARQLAYRLDDPVQLARATLAGVHWGATQTALVEDPATIVALTDALAGLPASEPELRARVKAALALESRWSRPENAAALAGEAVVEARRAGEPATIAAALVARYTLGRMQPSTELDDADELRRIAAHAREPAISGEAAVIAFDARVRRAEMARADAELSTLERVAERASLPYFRWVALTRRAGWHVLLGNDEADAMIERAAELGDEIGIHPTLIHGSRSGQCYAAHMAGGRADAAVDALAALEPFAGHDVSWQSTMAAALAESGDLTVAARLFDDIITRGLDNVIDDQLGLTVLICLAWTAARLGDPRAGLLAPRLSARAGQLSWIASFSLGPIDLALAWTAIAGGELRQARSYLDSAMRVAQQARAGPWMHLVERERAAIT